MIKNTGLKTKYTPIEKIGESVYIIRWDYKDYYEPVYAETGEVDENGNPVMEATGEMKETNLATWMSEIVHFTPTENYIKDLILGYYNKKIDEKILSGFEWNGVPVWLSAENQFNYKAAYDLAMQTQGESLPVTFKFGTDEEPIYHTFENMAEFNDFYTSAIAYINSVLTAGWEKKDSIDWEAYKVD